MGPGIRILWSLESSVFSPTSHGRGGTSCAVSFVAPGGSSLVTSQRVPMGRFYVEKPITEPRLNFLKC
jgi:hypothetical protein